MRQLFTRFAPSSWEDWAWFFIWFTLPISIRLNSIALGTAMVIILISFIKTPLKIPQNQWLYLSTPILLFILASAGAFRSGDLPDNWKNVEKLLPLVVVPVLFMLTSTKKESYVQVSLSGLILGLLFAGVIMLGFSFQIFILTWDLSHFTYHYLTQPFQMGAIYLSLLLITAFFQIHEVHWIQNNRLLKFSISIFLLLLLLLAASKLFIILGLSLFALKHRHQLFFFLRKRKPLVLISIVIVTIALLPFINRIKPLADPHLEQVSANQYRWDSPLNGLNLRLIQWRFGLEILRENNAWISGIGISEAQNLLNQKYIDYGIYTGYENTSDNGYLDYNFHNQYVEALVRLGVFGLALLVLMFVIMLTRPKANQFASHWIILIYLAFFLFESALERQIGIVYFCLIYSSYFFEKKKLSNGHDH